MQKKWEAMGPGRKRARKSRSKKSIALAVTHEVDDWIKQKNQQAIYPQVWTTLFRDVQGQIPFYGTVNKPEGMDIDNVGDGVAPRPLRGSSGEKHFQDFETVQIAAFGMGSTAYDDRTFCKPAKDVFRHFMKLGARSLLASHGKSVVGMVDDDVGDCHAVFDAWMDRVVAKVQDVVSGNRGRAVVKEQKRAVSSASGRSRTDGSTTTSTSTSTGCCKGGDAGATSSNSGEGCACQEEKVQEDSAIGCCSDGPGGDDDDDDDDDDKEAFFSTHDGDGDDSDDSSAFESDYEEEKEPDVMDLEDIGNAMQASTASSGKSRFPKEMVTPKQAVALKKEGYRIIGTHSAVKLCRWTKHQLRGRGGCYKHSFYGITSYQCMEATPSLACANKCKCHFHSQ